MKRFIVLYKGPVTAPEASHEGWPQWFGQLGEKLVDRGAPLTHGCSLHGDGSTNESVTGLNGYSLIQAEDRDEALHLLHSHPYLSLGNDYTVEMFDAG